MSPLKCLKVAGREPSPTILDLNFTEEEDEDDEEYKPTVEDINQVAETIQWNCFYVTCRMHLKGIFGKFWYNVRKNLTQIFFCLTPIDGQWWWDWNWECDLFASEWFWIPYGVHTAHTSLHDAQDSAWRIDSFFNTQIYASTSFWQTGNAYLWNSFNKLVKPFTTE